MRKGIWLIVALALLCAPVFAADDNEKEARRIITEFQQGLAAHDVTKIEPLVAADMVAFENGHRNHSWQDFRDNHLLPEFKGPVRPMEWEFIKVVATQEMAWATPKAPSPGPAATATRLTCNSGPSTFSKSAAANGKSPSSTGAWDASAARVGGG